MVLVDIYTLVDDVLKGNKEKIQNCVKYISC